MSKLSKRKKTKLMKGVDLVSKYKKYDFSSQDFYNITTGKATPSFTLKYVGNMLARVLGNDTNPCYPPATQSIRLAREFESATSKDVPYHPLCDYTMYLSQDMDMVNQKFKKIYKLGDTMPYGHFYDAHGLLSHLNGSDFRLTPVKPVFLVAVVLPKYIASRRIPDNSRVIEAVLTPIGVHIMPDLYDLAIIRDPSYYFSNCTRDNGCESCKPVVTVLDLLCEYTAINEGHSGFNPSYTMKSGKPIVDVVNDALMQAKIAPLYLMKDLSVAVHEAGVSLHAKIL